MFKYIADPPTVAMKAGIDDITRFSEAGKTFALLEKSVFLNLENI